MNQGFGKLDFNSLDKGLSKSAIVLLAILKSHSKQKGYAFGTNRYYAEKLCCTTRTISNLIRSLLNKDLITIKDPKSFKRKIYVSK